jgi:ATP synthase protein I
MEDRPGSRSHDGTDTVWTIICLLVAGPAVWAAIGYGVDQAAGTGFFVPIGVVVGFVTSLYLVYVKYGRMT